MADGPEDGYIRSRRRPDPGKALFGSLGQAPGPLGERPGAHGDYQGSNRRDRAPRGRRRDLVPALQPGPRDLEHVLGGVPRKGGSGAEAHPQDQPGSRGVQQGGERAPRLHERCQEPRRSRLQQRDHRPAREARWPRPGQPRFEKDHNQPQGDFALPRQPGLDEGSDERGQGSDRRAGTTRRLCANT